MLTNQVDMQTSHCLRHTTGTLLATAGVHPKTAQSIMRHSTIELTMGRYTHTLAGQESEAVGKLPDLSLPSSQSQKAVKTGTDNTHLASYLAFETGEHRTKLDTTGQDTRIGDSKNALSNTPGRIRTCDLRIRNPLLCPTELRAHRFLTPFI
jgi:hypothetical protein